MDNEQIVIGGEKVFSISRLISNSANNIFKDYERTYDSYHRNYTFGGHYSLLAIVDSLKVEKNNSAILVPSYTCSSIIATLKCRSIPYFYYAIDGNLSPDFTDIKRISESENIAAIIFIDYMGKSQFDLVEPYLTYFKGKQIKIIQDCVHSLCQNDYKIYGDYAYNSFRKILPFEGSLLISKEALSINFASSTNLNFLYYKRLAQIVRYFHLKYRMFNPNVFLNLFSKAEKHYNSAKIYKLTNFQKWLIKKCSVNNSQSKHYCELLLQKYHNFTLERFKNLNFIPFGFFLVVDDRDTKRQELQRLQIYCPIHWSLPDEIEKDSFVESCWISQKCITIPLTEMDEKKFNYLITRLDKIIY